MNKLLKGTMTIVLSLTAFVVVALIALSIVSRSGGTHGLIQDKLQPCKFTQNCVCSEAFDNKNAQPINISAMAPETAWEQLKNAVITTGGEIQQVDANYLWAVYTTPVFRFKDDFEARLDESQGVIHLRSGSRVGHGDWGANKKRVDAVISAFNAGDL
jgi:uncharacterized protein (DUF1499 family)